MHPCAYAIAYLSTLSLYLQAKPYAGRLVVATVALLIASLSNTLIVGIPSADLSCTFILVDFLLLLEVTVSLYFSVKLQRKYGGKTIDIVSRDLREPKEQDEALDAVKNTILEIVLIVIVGYLLQIHCFSYCTYFLLFCGLSSIFCCLFCVDSAQCCIFSK